MLPPSRMLANKHVLYLYTLWFTRNHVDILSARVIYNAILYTICVAIRGFGTPWRTHNNTLIAWFIQLHGWRTHPDNVALTYICGEHLLRMWHLLRKTNGYHYAIIRFTKRFNTYGGNPPENAVPSTYDSRSTVNNKAIRDGRPRPPRHQGFIAISYGGSELRHRSILETITHRPKCQIQKL